MVSPFERPENPNQNDGIAESLDIRELNLLSLLNPPALPAAGTVAPDALQIGFLRINPIPILEPLPPAGRDGARDGGGGAPEIARGGEAQQGQLAPADRAAINLAARVQAVEPGPARLRAGVDFETPAPVGPAAVGTRYLQVAQERLPMQVRDHIQRTIEQLRSPDTRDRARERLREYGPAAVPALIAQLDSPDFHRRQAAHDQLRRMGDAAVPALLSVKDGEASLEMRRRCEQLISELVPGCRGAVHDAQGRLRRVVGKGEHFSADYDAAGRLTNVDWGFHGGREGFVRRADGTFTRSTDNNPVRDISVGSDGALSFRVGEATVRWSVEGLVQVTGAPVTSDSRGGIMTVPVRTGDTVTNVTVLPGGYPEFQREKR